ncbi:MAG TPA: hypothetical protein VE152_10135 [Acidimicrobiales bacterium]|nr:hypothetical protein [Acidimicrobiales bacterium]
MVEHSGEVWDKAFFRPPRDQAPTGSRPGDHRRVPYVGCSHRGAVRQDDHRQRDHTHRSVTAVIRVRAHEVAMAKADGEVIPNHYQLPRILP